MLHKRLLPPLGQRIIKTATAVFVLLIIYMLQGGHGSVSSACVTALLCIQPYASDSWTFAVERVAGTVLGSVWGYLYLVVMRAVPFFGRNMVLAYFMMAFFLVLALYSTVVIKRSSLAGLVGIVMLGIVVQYPNVNLPFAQTVRNFADTLLGTVVAVIINVAHLPRQKHPEYLFFVRTMDLVPDRYRQIPSSVHIVLDKLFKDGAKICLVSRWAPAFIMSQMGLMDVTAPMIIMDGAALYDLQENKYLDVIDMPKANVNRLRSILAGFNVGCNIYAVNERTLSIYRDGPMNEAEIREFETMKRSPYRNYLDGMYREEDRIAFVRIIDTTNHIEDLNHELQSILPMGMFRTEIREETRFPEYMSLYFYDPRATQTEMKRRAQKIMEQREGNSLTPVEMLPRTTQYLPEHDALMLLNRLKNKYEPVGIFHFEKKKNAKVRKL